MKEELKFESRLRDVKNCLLIEVREGQGTEESPVRIVQYFVDKATNQILNKSDPEEK